MRLRQQDYQNRYSFKARFTRIMGNCLVVTVTDISREAYRLFGDSFSDRLFGGQLAYYADIDYSEKVDYMSGYEVDDEIMRSCLIDKALEGVL